MGDKGHFTWEAVIALALLGMVLTSVQIVTLGSLARAERARSLYAEALAMEIIQLCLPRIGLTADAPVSCARSLQPMSATGGNLRLYAIHLDGYGAKDGRQTRRDFPFLRLEFAE